MNWKLIIKVLGILLGIEAGLLTICALVGVYYRDCIMPFVWPALIAASLSALSIVTCFKSGTNMGRKDGYLIVSLVWVVYSFVGMLPFLFSGTVSDVASAYFETMSGFTSTGATIIDNCDIQPRSILFWRSLAQWIGGIGIIFFTIAILPAFGIGEVKLFAAESTGPFHDKVQPRISVAARWIGGVYVGITTLCFLSLWVCGMSKFDAINFSFATTATGGYATHSDLLHNVYHSAAIEYVLIFFMFISGMNYTLIYYSLLRGRIKRLWHDAELRCYVIIVLGIALICTITLVCNRMEWEHVDTSSASAFFSTLELSLRESLFTVIALQTTTGLANCDYTVWPTALMPLLLFVMFAGACSGSTSSGFKCVRWSIVWRMVVNEIKHILHPRAVLPIRLNGNIIPTSSVQTLFAFSALFIGAIFLGAFILALSGVSPTAPRQQFAYYEALGLALSSISNVGPGMGYYGPLHSWAILSPFAKWTCSALMLIGRLEIFPILIIFTHSFWKKG